MSATFAHLLGVPLEEGLVAIVPAASALAVYAAVPFTRVGRCMRRLLLRGRDQDAVSSRPSRSSF
jgi:hypothetical protein